MTPTDTLVRTPPVTERLDTRDQPIPHVQHTRCCIVGAGPAGAVLALLLARQGVPVTLLEGHETLDRDFRGDTIHPAILRILDEIGLADRLLQQPHRKVFTAALPAAGGMGPTIDLRRLRTRFPFVAMMPQVEFLEAVIAEARQYPAFRLIMGASVQELVEDKGLVQGVRYRAADGWHGCGRCSPSARMGGSRSFGTWPACRRRSRPRSPTTSCASACRAARPMAQGRWRAWARAS